MKKTTHLRFAAASLAGMLLLASCTKSTDLESPSVAASRTDATRLSTSLFTSDDRIDAIMKDLSADSYSFSFEKANVAAGITRTAYGSDNYLVFADPQDMICPDPIRRKFPRIPIWKRPVFVQPTCPDLAIDIRRLTEIGQLITKINPAEFGELKQIKTMQGGGLLASQQMLKNYSNLKIDKLDELTTDFSGARFILLGAPDFAKGGIFTRNFYGYADLNELIFKPYKINLKDLIKPTLKGCFDPLILKSIREKLVAINPAMYKGLDVTTLPQNRNIAILN